jgi:tetratricopeptide (TPR) repeat protein
VPGWHDAVQDLYESGELQVVGIIQEQHPDRCRLFMQWKQMGWPILVDSLNLLKMEAVPRTVALDEHGIVRAIRLRLDETEEFRNGFMQTEFEAPPEAASFQPVPTDWPAPETPAPDAGADAWRRVGDLIVLSNDLSQIDRAVDAFRRVTELEPSDGWAKFRLGVALRKRHDSEQRRAGDFQAAVDAWKAALDLDPNQYIWRRRIQQYGPRLDKPYPFYDWVPQARQEIAARGEVPPPLIVEPGGAEFAQPQTEIQAATEHQQPDASGRVYRDDGELIALETVLAPSSIRPGEATRLHVELRPRPEVKAHWNNEVEGVEVWLNVADGCELETQYQQLPLPEEIVSLETRKAEYEIRCGEEAAAGARELSGHALYYVCEDVGGTCLYRRQDFTAKLDIR